MFVIGDDWHKSADTGSIYDKEDFLVYFHYTACVVVIKDEETDKERYVVRVIKTNTNETITAKTTNELGFKLSKSDAVELCNKIKCNPWKYLQIDIKTREQIEYEKQQRASFEQEMTELELDKKYFNETVQKRVNELLAEKKKEWEAELTCTEKGENFQKEEEKNKSDTK